MNPPHPRNIDSLSARALEDVAAHLDEFVGFAAVRLGSRADAEDLVQEAFVRAATSLHQIRDPARVVAWFYRIVRNRIADRRRRQRRSPICDGAVADGASPWPTPEQALAARDLYASLAALSPAYQRILDAQIEGDSLESFAASQGISRNNATVRLHRARAAARVAFAGSAEMRRVA